MNGIGVLELVGDVGVNVINDVPDIQDLDLQAGLAPDRIHENIAVSGLAYCGRGDHKNLINAILLEYLFVSFQDVDRKVDELL